MEHDRGLLEFRDTILADGIGRTCRHTRRCGTFEFARAPVLFKVFILRRKCRFPLGIDSRRVQAVAETEFAIENERRARADALPLFVQWRRRLVFGPGLEVGRGKVFEVVCTLPEFALVMATIIQIEYVVAPVIERHDIAHPVVVSG